MSANKLPCVSPHEGIEWLLHHLNILDVSQMTNLWILKAVRPPHVSHSSQGCLPRLSKDSRKEILLQAGVFTLESI